MSQTLPLPKGVRVESGRYIYFKKIGGKTKRIALTRVEEGEAALHTEYAKHSNGHIRTVSDLLYAYLRDGTEDLSPETVKGYLGQIKAKLAPVFGAMLLQNVTAAHVAGFLEHERRAGSPVSANRARAVLSSAFAYGLRLQVVSNNPCHGVRRNKERPSRRYVHDAELAAATNASSPGFALLLDAAYLTGLRQVDLINMRREKLTDAGIEVTESKTGKNRLVVWTDTLRQIVDAAIADGDKKIARRAKRHRKEYPLPEHVFVNHRAEPWTPSAISQAMERYDASFKFRELRPKAATDAAHNVLGHSGQMLARYVRREKLTPVK